MEETSLEDFLDGARSHESCPGESHTEGVEPVGATSRWRAGADACEACGERVERLWNDGDAWVCSDCMEW